MSQVPPRWFGLAKAKLPDSMIARPARAHKKMCYIFGILPRLKQHQSPKIIFVFMHYLAFSDNLTLVHPFLQTFTIFYKDTVHVASRLHLIPP